MSKQQDPLKSDIKTISIKPTSKLILNEFEYMCELIEENWSESTGGLPFPKMYPYVSKKDNYLVIPMIKSVLKEVVGRCNDFIDINESNLGSMGFAADNDRAGQRRIQEEIAGRKELIKAFKQLKRIVSSALKTVK
jgi:hypothetical protein